MMNGSKIKVTSHVGLRLRNLLMLVSQYFAAISALEKAPIKMSSFHELKGSFNAGEASR